MKKTAYCLFETLGASGIAWKGPGRSLGPV